MSTTPPLNLAGYIFCLMGATDVYLRQLGFSGQTDQQAVDLLWQKPDTASGLHIAWFPKE
jgi:hypothetical protein